MNQRIRTLAFALALTAVPAGVAAQQAQPAPTPPQPSQEQLSGWLAELQELHGRLETLQASALQDPQLSAAQQSLGNDIREAMVAADPQLDERMARVAELETQAAAAQQSGDEAKLQELGNEAMQIQRHFFETQQKVLQQPQLASQVEQFQEQLEAKMREVDPEADQLMTRFKELEARLAPFMQGAPR